jgi:VWFA-related protein
MRSIFASLLAFSMLLPAQQPDQLPVFRTSSNLVIVTVFVRDKNGKPLTGLKKEDFVISENGKAQTISVFDFQSLASAPSGTVTAEAAAPAAAPAVERPAVSEDRARFRDRRLMILFFDWSSLQTAQQVYAKEAARKFINEKLQPADMVEIVSFGTKLKVEQEFTSDKDALLEVIKKFQTGTMSENATDANTTEDTTEDSAFASDETEFNLFNTDRKMAALEDLARSLSSLPEKKAVVYFSGGVSRTGDDNQAQLRSAVNAAVKSNVSFYPVDVTGLQATPPGGAASAGGASSGTNLYSGATQRTQRDQQISGQDTLVMLAEDTGGKAFMDDNDLVLGIQKAQEDIQSYYILGYYSSDERKDGQFRRVDLKLAQATQQKLQAKLDYRRGYFSDKDFKAFNSYDKEKQLSDALLLGDPVTDLRVAMETNWFRLNRDRYFMPIALKIPGSAIPLKKKGSAETTTFDFIGQVKDAKGLTNGSVRDSIKIELREQNAGQLASRSLVYDTAFTVAPGTYRVKMLVRENLTGKMGTFETKIVVPDLMTVKDTARLSSLVLGSQRIPMKEAVGLADRGARKQDQHPLVRDKQKLLPSVTKVFHTGQTLSVYAELYDPTISEAGQNAPAVSAALTIYHAGKLVYQSQPVYVSALKPGRGGIAPISIEVPLKDFKPGEYTAQLNVIDRVGQKVAFARSPLVVLAR